jgi:hypothetical protein
MVLSIARIVFTLASLTSLCTSETVSQIRSILPKVFITFPDTAVNEYFQCILWHLINTEKFAILSTLHK